MISSSKSARRELDVHYMTRALKLASHGSYTTYPNPAVGCVFVRGGRIIGAGWHHHAGQPHAEIMALNNASGDVRGATAYVTLEPCSHYGRTPPCAMRLVKEGVARVVVAAGDPNPQVSGRGIAMLREAGIEVTEHVLEREAWFLNRAFMKAIMGTMPFVTLKVGMSLDGATAMQSGESKWITGPKSRADVQDLRAQCDVILTGSGTVVADDPKLSVRRDELPFEARMLLGAERVRQPLKVILDGRGRLDPGQWQIFAEGRVLWCTASKNEELRTEALDEHVTRAYVPGGADGHLDLRAILEYLGQKQYRRVMVEAGAELTGSFIASGLADEIYCYVAPKILGMQSRRAFGFDSPERLGEAPALRLLDVKRLGDDIRQHYAGAWLQQSLKRFDTEVDD